MLRTLLIWIFLQTATPGHAWSPYEPIDDPDTPRSDVFLPIVSFILPGFGQWWHGQPTYGAVYSGAGIMGFRYATETSSREHLAHAQEVAKDKAEKYGNKDNPYDVNDVAARKFAYGMQIYQTAGGMSAFHAFRTAVKTRQNKGQYDFLTQEETPLEIMLAPFDFKYLKRASTYTPLAIVASFAALRLSLPPGKFSKRDPFSSSDLFFTGGISYNAGTHEEAMFRGWVMPLFREYGFNNFWSNAAQSTLFSLAHLASNPFPLPQLLLGYHLGNVTQRNQWTLGESVFIHVWWDVLALAADFCYRVHYPDEAKALVAPVLWLPPVELQF